MALQITYRKKTGRPKTDIEPLILKIYYDAPKGLEMQQLAKYLGIGSTTFFGLQKEFPKFKEAINHYKRISPVEVLHSFKKIAVGYTFDEITQELREIEEGKYEMVITKIVTKHIAPNVNACIFYLKNQMPEYFSDKTETVISGGTGIDAIIFSAKRRVVEPGLE